MLYNLNIFIYLFRTHERIIQHIIHSLYNLNNNVPLLDAEWHAVLVQSIWYLIHTDNLVSKNDS